MAYTQRQLAELRAGALASVANLEALRASLAGDVADDERRADALGAAGGRRHLLHLPDKGETVRAGYARAAALGRDELARVDAALADERRRMARIDAHLAGDVAQDAR